MASLPCTWFFLYLMRFAQLTLYILNFLQLTVKTWEILLDFQFSLYYNDST